jgi:hypothetical protein
VRGAGGLNLDVGAFCRAPADARLHAGADGTSPGCVAGQAVPPRGGRAAARLHRQPVRRALTTPPAGTLKRGIAVQETGRRGGAGGSVVTRGRFDLPGAITGTGGVAALVYGLISAATTPNGVSHWGDAKVLASLAAAAVLLAAFAVIETRSPQALLPIRLLRDRTRTGAYLSYAGVGIFIFGMFFFLTVFMQAVWGYSALKTGLAYLPFTAALFLGAGAVAQLVPRIGARPILLAGSALSTGGLYWLSRISEHDTYASAVLGPTMLIGAGAALLFVTLSLVALNRVPEADSGVASSLLNTGQQAGGSIGLALLGTVAWTVVAHSTHAQAAHAAQAGHPARPGGPLAAAIYNHALATGFARGFLVAAGIALLTLIINLAVIRVRRADLAGTQQPEPAAPAHPAQPQ